MTNLFINIISNENLKDKYNVTLYHFIYNKNVKLVTSRNFNINFKLFNSI